MSAAVTTDEIYKRYLDKAIREILAWSTRSPKQRAERPSRSRPVIRSGRSSCSSTGRRRPSSRRASPSTAARGTRSKKSLERLQRRPGRGVRDELRQVRRRRSATSAAAWLRRELRIVQPKLVVVMGEDALEFLDEPRVPALASARRLPGRAPAVHADDRGTGRPGHRHLTRRPGGEDTLLERVQASRPLVGRAAALLTLVAALVGVVRGGTAPAPALAVAGRRRSSRSS